jgi:hypothetical protein
VGGARGQVAPGTSVVRPTAVLWRRLQRDGSQCAQRHKGGEPLIGGARDF